MINYHKQSEAIELIASLMSKKRLIPFFGTGFTMNESAKNGLVPSGNGCMEKFLALLTRYDPNAKFNHTLKAVSTALFKSIKHNRVPVTEFLNLLRDYFTEVSISDLKKRFLNYSWQFAFTLNVDDAIERNSDFVEILPYQNARGNYDEKNLYKIHGDAVFERKYQQKNNLVFNFDQYMHVIQEDSNQSIREALISAYKEFNLLFIGCSLDDEPDLKFLFNGIDKNEITAKKNIMLCGKKPEASKEEDLEDDYGITDIILIDDYNLFYSDVLTSIDELNNKNISMPYVYRNPKIYLEQDKDKKYFTGFNIFDSQNNCFHKSVLFVLRQAVNEVESLIRNNLVVFIGSRRFSGKTVLLCYLSEREKTRTVYYFPTDTVIDSNVVYDMLTKQKDGLFLFDSNSMSSELFFNLEKLTDILAKNNNHLVIMLDQSESYPGDLSQSAFYSLWNKFTRFECETLNSCVGKYGVAFRKERYTNLDYLEDLHVNHGFPLSFDFNWDNTYTINEQILLLILDIKRKIYSRDYSISLKITKSEINKFIEKTQPAVEVISNMRDETEQRSTYKLVQNSGVILEKIISRFSTKDIIQDIRKIITAFKNGTHEQKRIYRDVMKFDSLNQLFGQNKWNEYEKKGNGAGRLIDELYANVEDLMGDDLHFWLQRAKSIYRLYPNNHEQLLKSYQYATKVYTDVNDISGNGKLTKQAALSISLICCLLFSVESNGEEKQKWGREAIVKGHEAIFSKYYQDEKYIKHVLTDKRKNYIDSIIVVCKSVQKYANFDMTLIGKANNVFEKMNELKGYHDDIFSIPK